MTLLHPAKIMAIVSHLTDVSIDVLQSKDRFKHIARARFVVYYTMRDQGYSYPIIGRCLGRDHTTIIAGFKKAQKLVYTNSEFNHIVTIALRRIHIAKEEGDMPAPTTLQEFLERCTQRVDNIAATNDEGMFARQYLEDVTILLRLLNNKNETPETLYQRSV